MNTAAAHPASPAQFAANRANAALSTGPSSPEGKAVSSRNNTRHGLAADPFLEPTANLAFKVMLGEDQSAYDQALADYLAEWQPVTPTETELVHAMTTYSWLRRRAHRLQTQMLEQGITDPLDMKKFDLYARYHSAHSRAFNKAFADLMRLRNFHMRQKKDEALLQKRAQDIQIRFKSQKRKAEEHAAKMETLRLKQEAQKQRNQPAPAAPIAASTPDVALNRTA